MTRRTSNLLRLSLIAVLACLVAAPDEADGSTLMQFRLANDGTKPVSGVDFTVEPPGAIVPPVVGSDPTTGKDLTGSPVTILPNSTGFDASKFSVALGSGSGEQRLRLLFGQTQTVGSDGSVQIQPVLDSNGQPLGLFLPGAVLNFALNVDSAAQNALQLVLPDTASGLTLTALNTPPPSDPGTSPTPSDPGGSAVWVPEPSPLILWSALAALGLVRVRSYRRLHRAAA